MATPPPPQPPPPPPPPAGYPPRPPQQPHPAWLKGPVSRREIRPSRLWYWVTGVIGLAAVVGAILVFTGGDDDLGSLTDVFTTLEELQVPGEITVDLPAGEDWAIYRHSSESGGAFFEDDSALDCRVRAPDGSLVPLTSDFGFSNVTLNDELYVTEYKFQVPESGSYEVSCEPGRRVDQPGSVLVGKSLEFGEVFGFFGRVAAGIAILLLGLLATAAIALPVALTRSKRIGEARRAGMLRD